MALGKYDGPLRAVLPQMLGVEDSGEREEEPLDLRLVHRVFLTGRALLQDTTELEGDAITSVDMRPNEEVHQGAVTDALDIPAGNKVASYGAWAVDPETDSWLLVLFAPDQGCAQKMWGHLIRVGIDPVTGYLTSLDGLPLQSPRLTQPEELADFDAALMLDVRNKAERAEAHIPGSKQLNAGGEPSPGPPSVATSSGVLSWCFPLE